LDEELRLVDFQSGISRLSWEYYNRHLRHHTLKTIQACGGMWLREFLRTTPFTVTINVTNALYSATMVLEKR